MIDTLVTDIQKLFGEEPHECNPENLERLGREISLLVGRRLSEIRSRKGTLRMSNLDKPDRQLWYEINSDRPSEKLSPSAAIKFLYGDILEALLLFLSRESGHVVENEQRPVDVLGIKGSMDCTIDGVVVDIKSASSQSFSNFSEKLNPESKFSYAYQINGYMTAEDKPGALLVIDKQLGHLALHKVTQPVDVLTRVRHLKNITSRPEPPERCYEPVPEGKSGNLKLGIVCSYCQFKQECYPELKKFLYSSGPVYLTKVVRTPDVLEMKMP